MTKANINELPELVASGKLKLKEAARLLWTEIYGNPFLYGLKCLDEDQKSDYLISISHKFENIISSYKNNNIDFIFYVKGCLKMNLNSWLRKQLKYYASENCLSDQFQIDYEIKETESSDFNKELQNSNSKIESKIFPKLSEKRKKMLQEYIHILACRACNELDENLIEKISGFLNIPVETFRIEIEGLKKSTKNKLKTRKEIIQRRNKAFFFRKKYLYELLHMEKDSAAYQYLLRKFKAQSNSWQQINELLTHRYSITPSNEEISENTGLKPRKIYYYINHKKKSKNLFPFIELPQVKAN